MTTVPTAAPNAPTYNPPGSTSVTLNNVPGLSAASGLPSSFSQTNTSGTNLGSASWAFQSGSTTAYTNGTYNISYNGNFWGVYNINSPSLIYGGVGNSTTFPTSWTDAGGTAPPPIFSPTSGANAATSLNIDRALDSGFTTGLTTFTGVTPSTNYVDNTVSPDTAYWYRYTEVNSAGQTPGSGSSVTTLTAAPTNLSMSYVM